MTSSQKIDSGISAKKTEKSGENSSSSSMAEKCHDHRNGPIIARKLKKKKAAGRNPWNKMKKKVNLNEIMGEQRAVAVRREDDHEQFRESLQGIPDHILVESLWLSEMHAQKSEKRDELKIDLDADLKMAMEMQAQENMRADESEPRDKRSSRVNTRVSRKIDSSNKHDLEMWSQKHIHRMSRYDGVGMDLDVHECPSVGNRAYNHFRNAVEKKGFGYGQPVYSARPH